MRTRLLLPGAVGDATTLVVTGDERHYLGHVRRHRPGDEVEVRDASGACLSCRVETIGAEEARLTVLGAVPFEAARPRVIVVAAVPKRPAFDDAVRELSELGVAALVPVVSERTILRPSAGRLDRWRRIAEEAVRQCGRERPMEVAPIGGLETALEAERADGRGARFLLHHEEPRRGLIAALAADGLDEPVVLAIGPEGGFTEAEVARAGTLGFLPVALGPLVLRSETAAVVAATLALARLGALSPLR